MQMKLLCSLKTLMLKEGYAQDHRVDEALYVGLGVVSLLHSQTVVKIRRFYGIWT